MTVAADVPAFDTQQSTAEIQEAGGFSQQQADAIVRGDVRATANLVTRDQMNTALDRQTAELRTEIGNLRTEIGNLRTEIYKAINGLTWRFVAATGAMLGLLRWLFPTGPVS